MSAIHIETQGAGISSAERAVLDDIGRAIAVIHKDRQTTTDPTPSLSEAASGLIGLLAARNWRESDSEAHAALVGVAALLMLESGAAVIAEIPAKGQMH